MLTKGWNTKPKLGIIDFGVPSRSLVKWLVHRQLRRYENFRFSGLGSSFLNISQDDLSEIL